MVCAAVELGECKDNSVMSERSLPKLDIDLLKHGSSESY